MKFTLEQALDCYEETGINILNGSDQTRSILKLQQEKFVQFTEAKRKYKQIFDKNLISIQNKFLNSATGKKCMAEMKPYLEELNEINNEIFMSNMLYFAKIKPYFDVKNELTNDEFEKELNILIENIRPKMTNNKNKKTAGEKNEKK